MKGETWQEKADRIASQLGLPRHLRVARITEDKKESMSPYPVWILHSTTASGEFLPLGGYETEELADRNRGILNRYFPSIEVKKTMLGVMRW